MLSCPSLRHASRCLLVRPPLYNQCPSSPLCAVSAKALCAGSPLQSTLPAGMPWSWLRLKLRTWYSHCDGITSALMPEMLMPAYMQHLRCASTTSRAMAAPAPALRAQRHNIGAGASAKALRRGEQMLLICCCLQFVRDMQARGASGAVCFECAPLALLPKRTRPETGPHLTFKAKLMLSFIDYALISRDFQTNVEAHLQ